MKIMNVCPVYTGGGIYVITGEVDIDGKVCYYISDTGNYDTVFVDGDPWANDENGDPVGFWMEWRDAHLVKDLEPNESLEFIKDLLRFVIKNGASGNHNYSVGDMEEELEYANTLVGDWR